MSACSGWMEETPFPIATSHRSAILVSSPLGSASGDLTGGKQQSIPAGGSPIVHTKHLNQKTTANQDTCRDLLAFRELQRHHLGPSLERFHAVQPHHVSSPLGISMIGSGPPC